jgi:hypothetical protein
MHRLIRRGSILLTLSLIGAALLAAWTSAGKASGFDWFAPRAVPISWHDVELPNRSATLSFPPTLQRVQSDAGAVSFARTGPRGEFVSFLNVTPKQGGETLANWSTFRISHLLEDDAASATLESSAQGLTFTGGKGSCVMDHYVTRVGANHFRELACLVQGTHGGSVIVAASPTAKWDLMSGALEQAVEAFQVR